MKHKFKPFQIFVPITRVDDEKREIEGIAFANEVVEGEGGIRLKRTAMENSTPEYMQWGAVREMHQPSAVGTAIGVEWNADGAYLRAKIVDDDAWNKVKAGVYKGLSVGVAARVMRGKDVEVANWIETSLVDRPKDPDAKIVAYRADDMQDEYECEVEEEKPVLRSFSDMVAQLKKDDVYADMSSAWYAFIECCFYGGDALTTDVLKQNISEFSSYLLSLLDENADALRGAFKTAIARRDAPQIKAPDDWTEEQIAEFQRGWSEYIGKVQAPASPITFLTRAEAAESELAIVRAALSEKDTALAAAVERVKRLEAEPAPTTPPARYPAAYNREFAANNDPTLQADAQRQIELLEEYQSLQETLPKEPDEQKRLQGIARMSAIRSLCRLI